MSTLFWIVFYIIILIIITYYVYIFLAKNFNETFFDEDIKKIKEYVINKKCDKCGKGFLFYDNVEYRHNDKNLFVHRCDYCGNKQSFERKYPLIKGK